MIASTFLTHAFKEWSVAINAMEAGQTIMLLRKGGIREQRGRFEVDHTQVLLFPTYEHQNPEFLKNTYTTQVQKVESGWHPAEIKISSWAEITDILPIFTADNLECLFPFHIWNQRFIQERLKWKPRQPLYILLLRVYLLSQPFFVAYDNKYGGCKSWIDLEQAITLDWQNPAISESDYSTQVSGIRQILDDTIDKKMC